MSKQRSCGLQVKPLSSKSARVWHSLQLRGIPWPELSSTIAGYGNAMGVQTFKSLRITPCIWAQAPFPTLEHRLRAQKGVIACTS